MHRGMSRDTPTPPPAPTTRKEGKRSGHDQLPREAQSSAESVTSALGVKRERPGP